MGLRPLSGVESAAHDDVELKIVGRPVQPGVQRRGDQVESSGRGLRVVEQLVQHQEVSHPTAHVRSVERWILEELGELEMASSGVPSAACIQAGMAVTRIAPRVSPRSRQMAMPSSNRARGAQLALLDDRLAQISQEDGEDKITRTQPGTLLQIRPIVRAGSRGQRRTLLHDHR